MKKKHTSQNKNIKDDDDKSFEDSDWKEAKWNVGLSYAFVD